jgi:hypothetical protein
MANTVIQLKYSLATAAPASLNVAEAAYSFQSNKLFIGNNTNGVITIGGKYYTDIVDAATDLNAVSTLVKRDTNGSFAANVITATSFVGPLTGNASTATKWQTARNIGLTGEATGVVSVDGSANANIPLTLTNTGVTAGSYGSGTLIPVITVAANGRVTNVTTTGIGLSASLAIAGDSGTDTIVVGTDTLTFVGGAGITSTVGTNNVTFDVDNTVVRTTGGTISGDLAITGNLIVSGNTVTQDVENVRTEDPLIQLASNNATDVLDIGFFGQYNATGTKYTGLIRDASDGQYKLLTAGTELPSGNTVNVAAFSTGTLVANITGGTVSGLSADIAVADGGTGRGTFTTGAILVGAGTGALGELANVTVTSTTLATSNTLTSVSTDGYGRITAVTATPIAISATQVTSGTLPIARGGTGATTLTNNGVLLGQGTNAITAASSSTEGHVLTINASGVPTFSHLSGGTF